MDESRGFFEMIARLVHSEDAGTVLTTMLEIHQTEEDLDRCVFTA